MPEKLLKRKSNSAVLPAVLKTRCNEDICPFTLELVEGCKIRNSIDGGELCFYARVLLFP
jgi:hypothetical protein